MGVVLAGIVLDLVVVILLAGIVPGRIGVSFPFFSSQSQQFLFLALALVTAHRLQTFSVIRPDKLFFPPWEQRSGFLTSLRPQLRGGLSHSFPCPSFRTTCLSVLPRRCGLIVNGLRIHGIYFSYWIRYLSYYGIQTGQKLPRCHFPQQLNCVSKKEGIHSFCEF